MVMEAIGLGRSIEDDGVQAPDSLSTEAVLRSRLDHWREAEAAGHRRIEMAATQLARTALELSGQQTLFDI